MRRIVSFALVFAAAIASAPALACPGGVDTSSWEAPSSGLVVTDDMPASGGWGAGASSSGGGASSTHSGVPTTVVKSGYNPAALDVFNDDPGQMFRSPAQGNNWVFRHTDYSGGAFGGFENTSATPLNGQVTYFH